MLKSSFVNINSKRSIHISPSLNTLSMEALKRPKDDSDKEDTSAVAAATSESSPASKKRKVETGKPKATKGIGKPKQDGEIDPKIANVPLFESNMQFPEQLWHLLKHDDLKEAIWWLPGDDAFAINETKFSELLLESHFRKNRFTSIIRKLNRWGYRKFVDRSLPAKTVAYYHRSFQKGRRDLLKNIEKEEGKPIPNTGGGQSHYSLFPEATTSHGIMAQMRQPNNPLPGLLGVTGMNLLDPSQGGLGTSRSGSLERSSAGIAARMNSLDTTGITSLGTPLNQRQLSSNLHSVFGQGGSGGLPSVPAVAGLTASPSLAHPSLRSSPTSRSRELLRLSNLELSLAHQRPLVPAESATDRQALLTSMVSNMERERQHQQHDGRLLEALERQRRQSLAEEQKQEIDDANLLSLISSNRGQSLVEMRHQERMRQILQKEALERRLSQEQKQEVADAFVPSTNADPRSALSSLGSDESNIYYIMSNRRRQSLLEMHGRHQQDSAILSAHEGVLRSTQLLEAAERQRLERTGFGNQFQLHRQLQAAIASPNPLLANPLPSTGQARRLLGQELPGDLLLSPQQRVREQIRMLQQQQMEDALQRESNPSRGNQRP